eukprot:scaffold7380_cov240-Pinguiococcus_pyrenoidosus.AAC.1
MSWKKRQYSCWSARVVWPRITATPLNAAFAPQDKDPPETLVEVHVEASPIFFLSATGAPAGHLGTDAATARLAAMGEVLQAVYGGANAVDVEKLEIVPGKFAWMVYVDVLLMRDSGNALDAAAAAVYTAMQVARIPATMPVLGEREEIDDFDIVHRTEDAVPLPFKLDADSLPLCITLARIGERFVVDPTDEEERCALTQLVVAVSQGGDVRGIHKLGGEPLAVDALLEFVDAAKAAASGLFPCLKHVVVAAAEDTARDEPVLRPNLGLQFGR